MAVLLNELFFPKTDVETAKLISAFTFCLTFVFRPVGAIIFGYLGDTIDRKYTVIITTFLMALFCFVMTQVQTYAQIGIAASWIVSVCRVVQGMCSMGEIIGAEIYISESINPPARYPAAAFIVLISKLGGSAALIVGTFVLFYGAGWRSAFGAGCIVAIVGLVGRIALKETPEFLDSKNNIKTTIIELNLDPKNLNKSLIYTHRNETDVKSCIYYTLAV
jgi:MHS family proline/betaine transporter-like MFS transporter